MNKDKLKDKSEYVNGFLLEDDSPYKLELIECPICGKMLFNEPASYESCDVCGWYNNENAEYYLAVKKGEKVGNGWDEAFAEMLDNYKKTGKVK